MYCKKPTWLYSETFLQGLEIYPRPGDGKIISNQSLVLQQVKKEDAGNYTCQAFNVEGQMESSSKRLDIMCKCSHHKLKLKLKVCKKFCEKQVLIWCLIWPEVDNKSQQSTTCLRFEIFQTENNSNFLRSQTQLSHRAEDDLRRLWEGDGPHLLHGRLQPQGRLFLLDAEHDRRYNVSLIGKLHYSKNLPVIFAKRNLSLFIDILLFLAKLSKNWEVMIGCSGQSDIPGAMSTDMSGASLLTYKPMSQVL